MKAEELKNVCLMYRAELERQGAGLGIMSLFDSLFSRLGEESRRANKAERVCKNRE